MSQKVYTKTGDKGTTSLIGGQRVEKHHPKLHAYGTVDELNSAIGFAVALLSDHSTPLGQELKKNLTLIQNHLFNIGSHLACDKEDIREHLPPLKEEAIAALEDSMDAWQSTLPPLQQFILPGGDLFSSQSHICRVICRRAERHCSDLPKCPEQAYAIRYLNRLSDFFFVMARKWTHEMKIQETTWEK